MKYFVTGGSGFIGKNFIFQQINDSANSILNLDKLTYAANNENLNGCSPNYNFVEGDINDEILVKNIFDEFKPDVLINFAAETHVDRSIDSPNIFINTNVLGTLNLLKLSLGYLNVNKKFKFIHVSTDEVYGSLSANELPFSEQSAYRPNSPYSASKASSDFLVRAWNRTYGLETIITNCSNNYGPYQFPEKLIPLMIINCLDEKNLPIYGDGKNVRDWLFVNDHCSALQSVIAHGTCGKTYNIGGNNEVSNIDLVSKICSILDELRPRRNGSSYEELISFVEDRPGHDFRYSINCDRIVKETGWKPRESFLSGLKKTIKWYLTNEEWWREIQKGTYNQERLGL